MAWSSSSLWTSHLGSHRILWLNYPLEPVALFSSPACLLWLGLSFPPLRLLRCFPNLLACSGVITLGVCSGPGNPIGGSTLSSLGWIPFISALAHLSLVSLLNLGGVLPCPPAAAPSSGAMVLTPSSSLSLRVWCSFSPSIYSSFHPLFSPLASSRSGNHGTSAISPGIYSTDLSSRSVRTFSVPRVLNLASLRMKFKSSPSIWLRFLKDNLTSFNFDLLLLLH